MGTAKVHAAQKIKGVHIVWARWLLDTTATWCRQPEALYHLDQASGPPLALQFPPHSSSTFVANTLDDLTVPPSDSQGEVGEGDGDVDVAAINWADAAKEIDDFLNETDGDGDDSDDDSDDDDDEKSDLEGPAVRKRVRVSTDSEDERIRTDAKRKGKATNAPIATGSALSKRIKRSQARKSGLKVSFPPQGDAIDQAEVDSTDHQEMLATAQSLPSRSTAVSRSSLPTNEEPPTASQGSSLDSDDEAFFASMAADVEAGWT